MEIKLTKEQITLIENRLKEVVDEESKLRIKQKTEDVDGWDFVALDNEKYCLETILKTEVVNTDDYL